MVLRASLRSGCVDTSGRWLPIAVTMCSPFGCDCGEAVELVRGAHGGVQ